MLYFIINETSRTGKSADVWNVVEQLVLRSKLEYQAFKTEYEGHAAKLAAMISNRADDDICLVVVGGDGTVNEVLNGMTNFEKIRFGVIPTGSGNDFGRGLKLPKGAEENWEIIKSHIIKGRESYHVIDLGQVEWSGCKKPRLFGISAGVGLDAIVCKKALHSGLKTFLNKVRLGKLTYVLLTVQTLFSMDTAEADVTYRSGAGRKTDAKHLKEMIFSAAMNLRAEGGGVPMAPKGNPYDGLLSVSSAYGIPKWRTFFCLPLLMAAKHERINGFQVVDSEAVHMKFSKPMVIHADGEYCGEAEEVTFTCLPNRLKLLMD